MKIFICLIFFHSAVKKNKSAQLTLTCYTKKKRQDPTGLDPVWKVRLFTTRNSAIKAESQPLTAARFELDLSNTFIRISLIFHITARKCQRGKHLMNDKMGPQLCLIRYMAAVIILSRCRTLMMQQNSRWERHRLLAYSEMKYRD